AFKEEMLPWLDLILYDLKVMDSHEHLRWTGCDNERILRNFTRLLDAPVQMIPRIPLIPGFTTSEENLEGFSSFLRDKGVRRCALLPYNPLGLAKWENLGKEKPPLPETWMEESQQDTCRRIYDWAELVNF
ncbi:MAG: hypothetical protein MUC98_13990, partial [Desulfobacterota bacterium]|nr:hypothetical protein [Thermodesulfobacteriota bacterium]